MIKLAIADAHAVIRSGVRSVVEPTNDIEVVGEAFEGDATMALVHSTEVHVLTLGLAMPGLHGVELIKEIRSIKPSLRILVLTMHSKDTDATQSFRDGASGFLVKSSPADELLQAIRKVASGGIYINRTMTSDPTARFDETSDILPHQRITSRELHVFLRIADCARTISVRHRKYARHKC
jgi:DNA-binding NarL/FixJ family response regulator